MSQVTVNTAGIAATAFIIAVLTSMAYYQFIYVPEASKRPVLPEEVLHPAEAN